MADLVYDVWEEHIHPAFLMAIVKNGGVGLLAWDGETPVGFCLSFAGFEIVDGVRHLKQHSHMAAMLPTYRDKGRGAQLKWVQRNVTLAQNIKLMTWTFDPLETRNARMNLHKLGAVCNIFLPNVYGTRDDPFSAGLPTDRFHVHWWLDSERVAQHAAGTVARDTGSFVQLNQVDGTDQWVKPTTIDQTVLGAPRLKFAVPKDFQALKRHDMGLARTWRGFSAETFTTLFTNQYTATDLLIADNHCAYIFSKQT